MAREHSSGIALGAGAVVKAAAADLRWLLAGVLFVVVVRLALYLRHPELGSDFDLLYYAAQHLLRGENPYPIATQWFPYPLFYPLPAVLLAVPFTTLPAGLARPTFDILIGSAFAYALWTRGPYALLALLSGAYLFSMRNGQTTPLLVAASLIPSLGFLLAVKPNTGLALWISHPNHRAVIMGVIVLLFSLAVLPSWPMDWLHALRQQNSHLVPPILRPFGFLLLLSVLRWRTPEGRLLLALAIIPQNTLPHELVPLALIPGNHVEMGIYVVGTWFAMAIAARGWSNPQTIVQLTAAVWPVTLLGVYLPCLWMVLRRRAGA